MRYICLSALIFFCFPMFCHSQSVNIGSQPSVTTCYSDFFDAGGMAGYAGYDYKATTFFSGSDSCLKVSFEDFDLGFGAELRIYKGSSVAGGILIGTYSGTNTPPLIYENTLTFEYIPPFFNMGNIPGWSATILCSGCNQNTVRSDPASDCVGAIPLCANSTVIVSTNQYTDTGADDDENGSCISGTGSGGSVWYTFQPQTSGQLDFSIAPDGGTDYDYVLYDATNGCDNLDEISCNYSADFGTTGLTTNSSDYTNSYSGCTGSSYYSAPADCGTWNETASVTYGNTYVLFINFYSGSNDGFTLQFQNDPSTVEITDNIPPTFENVTQPGCNGSQIHVDFSENIDCTTLQASDFTLPGYSVSISSSGCVNGMTTGVDLTITPALPPGSYNLAGQTMNDMCGNPLNDNYPFTIANAAVTVNVTGSDFCQGSSSTLTANATGTGTLNYNWSNGGTGSTITVSTAGNYCVTVSDQCANSASDCQIINSLSAPVINTSFNCVGGSSADLIATGCTGTFTWNVWDTVCTTTCLGVIVFGNCVGTWITTCDSAWVPISSSPSYTVNAPYEPDYTAICVGSNGCSTMQTVTVDCLSPMTVSLNSSSVCPGGCANISATITGGTAPYTYTWNPGTLTGAGPQNVCPSSTTVYSVTVNDSGGNSASASCTVTVNAAPGVNAGTDVSICIGGSTTITASGASTYSWSGGLGAGASQTVSPAATTTYTVTGTDAGGCTNTDQVTVTVGSSLTPTISGNLNICSGSSTTLDAGSGYTGYSWSSGGSTQTINVSTAGTYSVTVSDAGGCSGSTSVTVNVSASLSPTISGPLSICNGTSTTLDAGTAYSNYNWSTSATTQTISVSTAGIYSVTVSDAGGCSGSASVTVTLSSNLSPSITGILSICTGASTSLDAGAGYASYNWSSGASSQTISVSTAGTYTVTVSDAGGCSGSVSATVSLNSGPTALITGTVNASCGFSDGSATAGGGVTYLWSNSQTGATANNLAPGTYYVTVTDANGCTGSTSAIISNNSPYTASASSTDANCGLPTGTATVTPAGGTCPTGFTFTWNTTPLQTTQTATNLTPGTYSVTVGCNTCQTIVTTTVNNIPGPTAQILSTIPENCGMSNGSVTASATGGTAPYSFLWNTTPSQSGQTATNITSGLYVVTVTDANSCQSTISATISMINGPSVSAISNPEYCGQSNGSATATATGGLGTYNFTWNSTPPQSSATATNLPEGTYIVTVSDGGCTTTTSVSVTEIDGPDAGFSVNPQVLTPMDGPVSFLDNSSGNITDWQWNLGDGSTQNTSSFDHLYNNIGTYVVTLIVTDNNGCTDTVTDTIKVKEIYTLYIPNVFSPNGDGKNDYFLPQGLSVDPDKYEMAIFNRWGNMVFRTTTWGESWNGTKNNEGTFDDVIMDVYVYRIKAKEIDGPKHDYIGHVTLLP